MKKKLLKSRLLIAVTLGLFLAIALYFLYSVTYSKTFLPGIYIADTLVAGKTEVQAARMVESRVRNNYSTPVTFYKDSFEYKTTVKEIAKPADLQEDIGIIWEKEQQRPLVNKLAALFSMQSIPYYPQVNYDEDILQDLVIEWNETLKVGAKNATLEMDMNKGLIIIPERSGLQVDYEKTFAALPMYIEKENQSFSIPIQFKEEKPKITVEELSDMGEISSYTTKFNTGEINRSKNLRLAASRINGIVLDIGEEFQFNRTVGKRTIEEGFSDALIVVGNKFEPGLGGGVCQVSSTIYNACLLADLEVVERHNHGLSVAYVPLGLDATVYYGVQDLRFKNNTSTPIYIGAITDGGQLTISIYGNLKDKKNVKLSYVVDQVIGYSEVVQPQANLQPGQRIVDAGGQSGYSVRAFQSYYDDNGELISTKQLSTNYYRPMDRVVLVGPESPDAAGDPDNYTEGGGYSPANPGSDYLVSEGWQYLTENDNSYPSNNFDPGPQPESSGLFDSEPIRDAGSTRWDGGNYDNAVDPYDIQL